MINQFPFLFHIYYLDRIWCLKSCIILHISFYLVSINEWSFTKSSLLYLLVFMQCSNCQFHLNGRNVSMICGWEALHLLFVLSIIMVLVFIIYFPEPWWKSYLWMKNIDRYHFANLFMKYLKSWISSILYIINTYKILTDRRKRSEKGWFINVT